MKFFPRDWIGDPDLRALSYAARGLWTDMLSIMFLSTRQGFLLAAGKPLVTPASIARHTSGRARETARLLAELEEAGMISRDTAGTIYSRRMLRDRATRERKRQAGQKGGNPSLLNRPDKQAADVPDACQDKPRVQSPEPRDSKHTQPPESGGGFPPSLEDVEAEAVACGQPPGEASRFWHYWEQHGWRGRDGMPLDWRSNLHVWTPKAHAARPRRGASAKPAKRQRWQIAEEINASKARIVELKKDREVWEDQLGVKHGGNELRPEAKRQLERERKHLAKLQAEWDNAIDPEAAA